MGRNLKFLIIGGSDAGISAALRARELDESAAITVVLADGYPNFSICELPFFLSGETQAIGRTDRRTLALGGGQAHRHFRHGAIPRDVRGRFQRA